MIIKFTFATYEELVALGIECSSVNMTEDAARRQAERMADALLKNYIIEHRDSGHLTPE